MGVGRKADWNWEDAKPISDPNPRFGSSCLFPRSEVSPFIPGRSAFVVGVDAAAIIAGFY